MIFVSVGTFLGGFDQLIQAADEACGDLGFEGFGQIGSSRTTPINLKWVRFLSLSEMQSYLKAARLVICHGGMGIIGDAMRAQRPIITVPRQLPIGPKNPINNQLPLTRKLAELYPIKVCDNLSNLKEIIAVTSNQLRPPVFYDLSCNIPILIKDFLESN